MRDGDGPWNAGLRRGSAVVVTMAVALAAPNVTRADPSPPSPEDLAAPARADDAADTRRDEEEEPIRVAPDGTVSHDRRLAPGVVFRVQHQPEPDHVMQWWPGNLVEGTQTTSLLGVVTRRFGPLTR